MLETASRAAVAARRCRTSARPTSCPTCGSTRSSAPGASRIPYTSGILIGIGETRRERVEALLALRELHERHGHLQEVIVQNFRAKPGTKMAGAPEPSLDDHLWTIAVARLLMPLDVAVQAPPNLAHDDFPRLLEAGIDDWGGVSPVTPDHVNPEAPWPELARLAAADRRGRPDARAAPLRLPALPARPERWLAPGVRGPRSRPPTRVGLARDEARGSPARARSRRPPARWQRPQLAGLGLGAVLRRARPRERGADLDEADADGAALGPRPRGRAAGRARPTRGARERNGDDGHLRRLPEHQLHQRLLLPVRLLRVLEGPAGRPTCAARPTCSGVDEVVRRCAEAWERGATEVCLQGGIHPGFTGTWYLDLVRAIRAELPDLHIHAFSPLEVWQGAATEGWTLRDYLAQLRDAGLGSLPGTAAEILDDEVRRVLCPDKLRTAQWLEVMRTAHAVGLRTTSTIMFGHIEAPVHQARHLLALRDLQRDTGGFTEFVPLPFVHDEAPIALKGLARHGPTFGESVVLHAAARLVLDPYITSIQASWVKLGPEGARVLLHAGVNDLGGTLMNESISRAAGASHGQECPPERMEEVIRAAGRTPCSARRCTATRPPSAIAASFAAAPLAPADPPPYDDGGLQRPAHLIRPGLLQGAHAE